MSSVTAPLTRAHSARIRELLRDKRARNAEGAFIIEGAKPVYDALLHYPASVLSVVVATEYERVENRQQRQLRVSRNISAFRCSDRVFSSLTSLESPQGILAVVRQPSWNEETLLRQPRLLGLYGEQLQDPANVGAIVRTAAALNIDALWLSPESADIYHPKVVRASSGAVLSLPIFLMDDVATLARRGIALFAAEATTDRQTIQLDAIRRIPPRLIIAVGNESRGLSGHTTKHASCRFTIPLSRHIDSLNVAATAAIALYYLRHIAVEP